MAQEYLVKDLKVGDYKDPHGNTWCTLSLEGISEPVRIVVKDPASITLGTNIYGHIETKTSQAGKAYQRFYKDQREDNQSSSGSTHFSPRNAKNDADTQESIARSVALKAAVDFATDTKMDIHAVINTADVFLTWLRGEEISMSDNTTEAEKPSVAQYEDNSSQTTKREWSQLGKGSDRYEDIPENELPEDMSILNDIFPGE